MKYNDRGEEMPDGTPVEVPLQFKRPPTLQEMIFQAVRAVHVGDRSEGRQSFRDANDFSDDDSEDIPPTPYELRAEIEEDTFRAVIDAEAQVRQKKPEKRAGEGGSMSPPPDIEKKQEEKK